MVEITTNTEGLFNYYLNNLAEKTPYFHLTTEENWNKSFYNDVDFEGENKFKNISTLVAREDKQIQGFIQFGLSNYSYDKDGQKDYSEPIATIRQLYFQKNKQNVGQELINKALTHFKQNNFNHYYAFFHALGMGFTSSHGKLFQDFFYIEDLLIANGFKIEHENIYYKKMIHKNANVVSSLLLKHDFDKSNHTESITFYLEEQAIGKCNIFYLPDGSRAYLRWIFLLDDFQNKGYGSQIMTLLCNYLYERNYLELHTDTADSNYRAQHYYLKNNFIELGKTRSYLV